MKVDLSNHEITILNEALDAWERAKGQEALFASMIDCMGRGRNATEGELEEKSNRRF